MELSKGLEKIGFKAFYDSGVERIDLPSSMRRIGAEAFMMCKQLRSVRLNEGLQTLGAKEQVKKKEASGASFAGSALESIKLPSTLKVIECATFA